MGIFFNTSGLITRGLGEANKILTRGFGNNDRIRGVPSKINQTKEYIFDICSPVRKTGFIERNIIVPVIKIMSKCFCLKSNVNKETLKSFSIETKTDSKKLFLILDSI